MKSQLNSPSDFCCSTIITVKDWSARFQAHFTILLQTALSLISIYVALLEVCILTSSILNCIFRCCCNSGIFQLQHVVWIDPESFVFRIYGQNVDNQHFWLGFDSRLNRVSAAKIFPIGCFKGPYAWECADEAFGTQKNIFLRENIPLKSCCHCCTDKTLKINHFDNLSVVFSMCHMSSQLFVPPPLPKFIALAAIWALDLLGKVLFLRFWVAR